VFLFGEADMSKFREQLRIYLKILRLNRRSTILSFIGLGFSLALISEGLIFAYSFQYGAFVEYMGESPTQQLTVSLISFTQSNSKETIDELKSISAQATTNAELTSRIRRIDWYYTQGKLLEVRSRSTGLYQILPDFNIYGIPYDYFTALQDLLYNGTLPQGPHDMIVVAKNSTIQQSNLNEPGLFATYIPSWGSISFDGMVDISGCITKETFSGYKGPLEFDFKAMCDYFSEEFILISADNFPICLTKPLCRYSFYLEDINSFNIKQEIAQIRVLKQELHDGLEAAGYSLFIYDDLSTQLEEFSEEYYLFQLFGLMILAPLVAIALYLSNYSANLLRKRQKKHIASLVGRGASKGSIQMLIVFQLLEITLSSLILCLVVGYPLTWLMLKSSGFLAFGGIGIYPAINQTIFSVLIVSAFVFSALINFKKSWTLSNIEIIEAHQEVQTEKPFWKKMYLDFILLAIGIILWLIVKYELRRISAYIFAYTIGIIAPVCIIVGGILITTRIYSAVMSVLGKRLWKRTKTGVFGLALLRNTRRQGTAIRGLILLSLTFSLIFSAIVSIESYNSFETETAYYSLGADILIQNVLSIDNSLKEQILALEGVESATYLSLTFQTAGFGGALYSYGVLGIDPEEFAATAYFENEYLGGTNPQKFFSQITDRYNIVMQKDEFNQLKTGSNTNLTLRGEKYGQPLVTYEFDVVDLYDYFPRFFTKYPEQATTTYQFNIVGTHDLVEEMAYSSFSINYDLLVKTLPNANITSVATAIEIALGREVENVEERSNFLEDSFRNRMLYGALNTALLSSIFIVILVLASIVFIQLIEYNREISILRSLGFSPKQFFQLFLSESSLLITFTIIFGSVFGSVAAVMVKDILTLRTLIPPSNLVFPSGQLILTITILILLSLITTAATVWVIFQRKGGSSKIKVREKTSIE